MSGWHEHFHLSGDPFSEDEPSWNLFYGGRYGIASLRLEQALERKRGIIVVAGPPGSGKSVLVRNALGRVQLSASGTVSAAEAVPASVIDVLLRSREPMDGSFSATRKRAALLSVIEQARASGRPIACVIEDAHHLRAGQLKDLLAAIGATPDAASVFQLILVGRTALLETLRSRTLSEVQARTTATIETEPLSAVEISEFLTERLEAVDAALPDVILPPATMAAITQHSRGVIGLAAALARAALERAAENGADSVSVETVEEVAALYGSLPASAVAAPHAKHATARAFGLGAIVALVVLALVVAAAEVKLLGSRGRRIEANVESLRALAGFGQVSADGEKTKVAQLGTPREEFLGRSGDKSTPPKPTDGKPYEVRISPPQRPESQAPAEEQTVITVPGIPGPLIPPATDSKAALNAPAPDAEPGPHIALQVGAFRERASAEALKNKLAGTFGYVYVSTIHSGGEPLHRVRVGRFKAPDETDALKARLQAAGYPSFRVAEP